MQEHLTDLITLIFYCISIHSSLDLYLQETPPTQTFSTSKAIVTATRLDNKGAYSPKIFNLGNKSVLLHAFPYSFIFVVNLTVEPASIQSASQRLIDDSATGDNSTLLPYVNITPKSSLSQFDADILKKLLLEHKKSTRDSKIVGLTVTKTVERQLIDEDQRFPVANNWGNFVALSLFALLVTLIVYTLSLKNGTDSVGVLKVT